MPDTYLGEDEMLDALEVFGLSCDPMYIVDDQCRIVFWNKPLQHLLGHHHDEVAGRSCSRVLQGDDHFGNRYCSISCAVVQIARSGEAVRPFRLSLRTKGGSRVLVDISVVRYVMRNSRRMLIAHVVRLVEEVVAAREMIAPPAPAPHTIHADARVRELTAREIEILSLLAGGHDARSIAKTLTISPLTTRNHIQHILTKLEVHSQTQAIAFAYRARILQGPSEPA